MTDNRNRCDDITELIDAALEDVLSTGGTQHTYDPGPGQHSDWLDDWREMDAVEREARSEDFESAWASVAAAINAREPTLDDIRQNLQAISTPQPTPQELADRLAEYRAAWDARDISADLPAETINLNFFKNSAEPGGAGVDWSTPGDPIYVTPEPSPEPWQLSSDPEWDWPTVPERWHRWFRRRHR